MIGLCGGSGSGKGSVGAIFACHGIPVIDTDAVYHQLTSGPGACVEELTREFGGGILNAAGGLDRGRLAEIVFAPESGGRLRRLNEIAHRHILARVRELTAMYAREGAAAAVIDAPVLFESGFDRMCDATVCVTAGRETRLRRITARDGLSREAAERRIASQMPDEELAARCTYQIRNDSTPEALRAETERVIAALTNILICGGKVGS